MTDQVRVKLTFWEDGTFMESAVKMIGYPETLMVRRGLVRGAEKFRVCPHDAPAELQELAVARTIQAFEDRIYRRIESAAGTFPGTQSALCYTRRLQVGEFHSTSR